MKSYKDENRKEIRTLDFDPFFTSVILKSIMHFDELVSYKEFDNDFFFNIDYGAQNYLDSLLLELFLVI